MSPYAISAKPLSCGELDLNQRPLGYEPSELPDCSIPHIFLKTGISRIEQLSLVLETTMLPLHQTPILLSTYV